MDLFDTGILAKSRTSYRNILETLGATMVVGSEDAVCTTGALRKLFLGQTAFLPGIDHSLRNGKLRLKSIPFGLKRRPL